MKKNLLFYLTFAYVLVFFVLPPAVMPFFSERQTEIKARYPLSVFLNGGIAFLIYFFSEVRPRIFDTPPVPSSKKTPFFVFSGSALVCFGILCVSSVIFEAVSFLLGIAPGIQGIVFPKSLPGIINFFSGVIFAVLFEEVIYRFFLPHAMRKIVIHQGGRGQESVRDVFLCEGIPVILFAAGHLYLGAFGFSNALICGIALRVCMTRTRTLCVPLIVHAAYNFLTFAMYWKLG